MDEDILNRWLDMKERGVISKWTTKPYVVEVFILENLDEPFVKFRDVTSDNIYDGFKVIKCLDGTHIELPSKEFVFKAYREPINTDAPIPQMPTATPMADMARRQVEARESIRLARQNMPWPTRIIHMLFNLD